MKFQNRNIIDGLRTKM